MQIFIIFATVLLATQAAQVPPVVTHQVIVAIPVNVLASSLPHQQMGENVELAVVKEVQVVSKQPEMEVMITVQPEERNDSKIFQETTTIIVPQISTVEKRKTRAVPYMAVESVKPQLATDFNRIKAILGQRKNNIANNNPHRSMRSVEQEVTTEPNTKVTATSIPVIPVVIQSSTINPCDLLCTKFELDPICASNGMCLYEFPNQCILETYNCKNPMVKFNATKDNRCQMHWLTKCDEKDMI